MKLYSIVILTLFRTNFREILCELIFEDNFNEFDSSKWQVISAKAECAKFYKYQDTCNTNNEANFRFISGSLALTARKEKYFESKFTTATIVSKRYFRLRKDSPSLLFKVRASLPLVSGLIPRVFLYTEYDNRQMHRFMTILNYDEMIWNGLANEYNMAKLTSVTNLDEFQDFEMIFHSNDFIWLINDVEYIRKNGHKSKYPDNHFSYDSNGFYPSFNYKLILTLDLNLTQLSETAKFNSCNSFIIDFIKVFQFNQSEYFPVDVEDRKSQQDAIEICKNINDLEDQAYIKFVPNNYSKLLFSDEFEGNSLNNTKWLIKANFGHCEKNFKNKEKSCDTLGHRNIEVSDGKLKLYIRNESYLGHSFTGVTIATRACFMNARIEILAKRPVDKGVDTGIFIQSYDQGCNKGTVRGQVDLVELPGGLDIFRTELHGSNWKVLDNLLRAKHENLDQFQVFGIEWTKDHIQWFLNDRVVYQANRFRDQNGEVIGDIGYPFYLPFDHTFNLLIHIGVDMFLFSDYQGHSTWKSPFVEIEHVRVYGERSYENSDELISKPENSNVSSLVIIGMSLVMIVLVSLLIIIAIIWRRQKLRYVQDQNDDHYDDTDVKNESYAEFKVENEHESVHVYERTDDYNYINQASEEHDYLRMDMRK